MVKYNIAVVGDKKVGKTEFIKIVTNNSENGIIKLYNGDFIMFFENPDLKNYKHMDGYIIMSDLYNISSVRLMKDFQKDIKKINVPYINLFNCADIYNKDTKNIIKEILNIDNMELNANSISCKYDESNDLIRPVYHLVSLIKIKNPIIFSKL